MQAAIALIFWIAIGLTLYVAVVSPCLLFAFSRLRRRFHMREAAIDGTDSDLPTVSVICPAIGGDKYLLDRLHNLLESNFPFDRLEIVVACSRQDELIGDLISTVNDSRVRAVYCDKPQNIVELINGALSKVQHEILFFTDCNVRFDRETIRRVASRFRNPHVGGVCGELSETNIDTLAATNEYEYHFGITTGREVTAYRTELLETIPTSVQNLDRFTGLCVYRSGLEIVIADDVYARRRSDSPLRIGGQQGMLGRTVNRLRGLLHELRITGCSLATWAICSHILRRIAPIFIVTAMMANAILAGDPFYLRLLLLHEIAYVILLMHLCLRDTRYWPLSRSRVTKAGA